MSPTAVLAATLMALVGTAFAQETSPRIDYGFPPRDYKRGEPPARGPAMDLALAAAQAALKQAGTDVGRKGE